MPLHEYLCKKCGHRFERIQKFSDPPARKCPECGGALEQLLHAPAVQFKGTGWYVTDYPRKGSDKAAKEHTATESKEPGGERAEAKAPAEPKKHEKKKK
ncbi:MAG: zinc ribbon domain-containing protein [Acidobacteria bacterium]|nr:zinc ribbon domain-containing protein [Acidobacteriota bacterium]